MKITYVTVSIFLFMGIYSCKSISVSPQIFHGISVEDFGYLKNSKYADAKAIVLSEKVNVRIQSMTSAPWRFYRFYNSNSNPVGWVTTVEQKTFVEAENINNESFSAVEYYNPSNMRWDLMTKCEMWICSLDKDNTIKTRKVNNNEMIRERLNDSISMLRLNIKESMAGKILLRQYTLISPYYQDISPESGFAEIKPWIFQRDIPLLSGKFEILLPRRLIDLKVSMDVVQLGEGEINIQSSFVKATMPYFQENHEQINGRTQSYNRQITMEYDAEKIVASVADVDALSKKENQQPLGIKFVNR